MVPDHRIKKHGCSIKQNHCETKEEKINRFFAGTEKDETSLFLQLAISSSCCPPEKQEQTKGEK